jgi:enoyl-CoA hydratase
MDDDRYGCLKITREGPVVTVALNRPERRNAINAQLHDELAEVFLDLDADDRCDVVVLTGIGECFSGGGDLHWIHSMSTDPVAVVAANRMNRRLQNALLDLDKPIIAKVRGAAIGLGCSIALFCDFVYATPETVFADPHVVIGLVAGDGGAVLWPQLVGYARARRYLLTGDSIRGAAAAEIGLITATVPDAELDEVVAQLVSRLVGGAKHAIRFTKASINAGLKVMANAVLDRATAYEAVTQLTSDHRCAVEAMLAKERPRGSR